MATKTGYSAGRVYLQVIPSYDKVMNQIRRDSPALARAIGDALKKDLDKDGARVGESLGQKINDGIRKGVNEDDFSRSMKRKMADVEKAIGGTHPAFHQLDQDYRDGKISSDEYSKSVDRMGHSFRKSSKDVDNHTFAIRNNHEAAARAILGQEKFAKATRDTDRDTHTATNSIQKLSGAMGNSRNDSQDGANAFRFFNFAILAIAAAGTGLIPIIGALGAGIAMLGTILVGVGAGAGVLALGFSGISAAVKALGAQQDATAKSSSTYQRAVVNAARGVADAQRSLKDAYRNSAEGVQSALEAQRNAEVRLAKTQVDARKAQRDLTQARKDAKAELASLNDQVAQNVLDERQAVIDLFNASMQNGAVRADGGSTNLEREQAAIALAQSQLNIKRIRSEQAALAAKKKAADKGGVNSTDIVKSAEDTLTAALLRQKEARHDLGVTTVAVDRARADGARSVADAQRGLTKAQEEYTYALKGGAASVDAVALAMSKLSPAGRRFAIFINSLRDDLIRLRNVAQQGILPGVQSMFERLIRIYGPGMTKFVDGMSQVLGNLFVKAGQVFTNPVWRQFFMAMGDYAGVFMKDFGESMLNWLSMLASLMTVSLPYAEKFSKALLSMSEGAKNWAASTAGQEKWRSFLEYGAKVGPLVAAFFGSLAHALVAIGIAMAPVGASVLSFLTDLFNAIAKMDPRTIRQIATGILILVVALQASSGIKAFVAMIGILTSSGMLGALAIVLGLAAAFFFLSRSSKDNKKTFDDLKKALTPIVKIFREIYDIVKKNLVKVFKEDLIPAFTDIANALKKDLLPALERFWPVIRPLVKFLAYIFGVVLGGAIQGAKDLILGIIKVLSGLMDFITGVFTGDWSLAWKGIKEIFFGLIQAIWGYVNLMFYGKILGIFRGFGKGVFGILKKLFTKDAPGMLKTAFKTIWYVITHPLKLISAYFTFWKDTLLKVFTTLKDKIPGILKSIGGFFGKYLGKPITSVIDFVFNKGLIGGINKLAGFVGMKGKDGKGLLGKIPIKKFATGGVMPGYAPGIDRHHIMVGGGEGILRPEITRVIGKETIDRWNNASIRGGIGGAMGAIQGKFARGGVFWPTNNKHWTTYAGHDGIDFNGPGNGMGDPYFASKAGRIAYTGWGRGYGNKVELKTDGGPTLVYGHSSRVNVKAGQRVVAGQAMGLIGSTGNSTGPHLHFGLTGEPRDMGLLALKFLAGGKVPSGGLGGMLGSLGNFARGLLKDPRKYLSNAVSGGFDKVRGVSGQSLELMKAIPRHFLGDIADKIKKYAMSFLGVGADFFKSGLGKVRDLGHAVGIGGAGPRGVKLYDQGGYLPPGLSTVINKTGRPEPVFSPDQWDKINRNGGAGGTTYNISGHGADPAQLASELVARLKREQRRVARSGTLAKAAK